MHRQLVTEDVSTAGGLDRIEIADDVGDGDVGRGELLDVALIGIQPRDRRVVSSFIHKIFSVLRDWRKRIVVDFAAGDDGQCRIEQRRQRTKDSRLRLTARSEQNEIVATQKCVDDLGHDRLFVADHAMEDRLAGSETGKEIRTNLIFD